MIEENKIGFGLMYALRCGINSDNLPQITKLFSDHSFLNPESYFPGGISALHYACSAGAIKILNYFLKDWKCDPNSKNSQYGMSPAHLAAINGRLEVIDLLYIHGANLFQTDNEGENIIHKALLKGDLVFLKNLLDYFDLTPLLLQGDKNNSKPAFFLKNLIQSGLHPLQLSKNSNTVILSELLSYLLTKTKEILRWDKKKYFLQLRLNLKHQII